MKSLFALSHRLFFDTFHVFGEQGTAYRFPGMLMAGLAVAIIFLWGRQTYGRLAGVFAALSFALMPRMFYHAHLACFDMPVAAMWLVTAYAYFRSLHAAGLGWAVTTGVPLRALTQYQAQLLAAPSGARRSPARDARAERLGGAQARAATHSPRDSWRWR